MNSKRKVEVDRKLNQNISVQNLKGKVTKAATQNKQRKEDRFLCWTIDPLRRGQGNLSAERVQTEEKGNKRHFRKDISVPETYGGKGGGTEGKRLRSDLSCRCRV